MVERRKGFSSAKYQKVNYRTKGTLKSKNAFRSFGEKKTKFEPPKSLKRTIVFVEKS